MNNRQRQAALVCFLLVATGTFAAPPQRASESPFGVVCPWSGIDEARIAWCRVGAGATTFGNWPDVEKSPGVYDWTGSDIELKHTADRLGLSLLPIFGYTPRWASSAPKENDFGFYPPSDVRHLSRFVRACVGRYKHRVAVWEVWNEPNIGFLNGTAAQYAEMVKAAAVAARQQDPDCRIAMGCAGADHDFLNRLYEFGCGPYIDVVSVHPYQWGTQLNDGWMLDKLRGCRELMARHGDAHKEIWITELGWSLAEGVTAPQQANLLAQSLVTALSVRRRLGVEKVFWFCVKDWGGPGHGLFDVDGRPKPAFRAYQALTAELADAIYLGGLRMPEGVRGHAFERAGQPVVVLWTPAADGKSRVEFKTAAARLRLRTVENRTLEAAVAAGRAAVEASHAPVFVTGLSRAELPLAPAENAALPKVPAAPPQRAPLCPVWISVIPPATTARPYLALGRPSELPLRVHNDGAGTARGEIALELTGERGTLTSGRLALDVRAGEAQTLLWRVALPADAATAGTLATLHITGQADRRPLARIDLPVRLVRARAIEFAANSWVERQYLHKADKSGCADSIRFGSEFGYRFDLTGAKGATLRINVGANGGNAWSVALSRDDRQYTVERSGKSWPGWQTAPLDEYLPSAAGTPATVYVRIQGIDCQVREALLDTH